MVQVAQPGADVQSAVETLLWVSLCGGKCGSANGELHARLLIRHLSTRLRMKEIAKTWLEGFSNQTRLECVCVCVSCILPHLVFDLCFPAALPLLKDFGQFVQTSMVEVQDLVLTLSAGYDQLTTRAGLITSSERQ